MAHASTISALTDELVQVITNYSPSRDARAYKQCKNAAVKDLRHHKYGRVNQFNIESSLHGLVEKFRVLDKDAVGDALESRLEDATLRGYQLAPEVLSLLLHLSDKPAEKSSIVLLDAEPQHVPPHTLTWNDIFGDEPAGESIDYAGGSSEDDITLLSHDSCEASQRTSLSSTRYDVNEPQSAEALVMSVDEGILDILEARQSWRYNDSDQVLVDEVQVIQEILYMLQGLPSPMFEYEDEGTTVVPKHKYLIRDCSKTVLTTTLANISEIGSGVNSVRTFAREPQHSHLMQRFSAVLSTRLRSFDNYLSDIEARYIAVRRPQIVSILALCHEIEGQISHYVSISSDTIAIIEQLDATQSYRVIDELHKLTSQAEMYGDKQKFEALAHILCGCLEVYMRPATRWIEAGVLPADGNNFFIVANLQKFDSLETFWTDGYHLRLASDGTPQAPLFLRDFMADILDSGKSVAFLHLITGPSTIPRSANPACSTLPSQPMSFTYASIFPDPEAEANALIPLSIRLKAHFQSWLHHTIQPTWPPLRRALFSSTKSSPSLPATLQTLSTVHYSSTLTTFANHLFARLDAANVRWANPTHLTHLLRTVYAEDPTIPNANPNTLTVSLSPVNNTTHLPPTRSTRILSSIHLHHAYASPLANIIPRASATLAYNAVSTLLLQLYRASSLLSPQILLFRSRPSNADLAGARLAASKLALRIRHTLLFTLRSIQAHICRALSVLDLRLAERLEEAESMGALMRVVRLHLEGLKVLGLRGKEGGMESVREAVRGVCDLGVLLADFVGGGGEGGEKGEDDGDVERERDVDKRLGKMWRQVRTLRGVLVVALRSSATAAGRGDEGVGIAAWDVLAEELEGPHSSTYELEY